MDDVLASSSLRNAKNYKITKRKRAYLIGILFITFVTLILTICTTVQLHQLPTKIDHCDFESERIINEVTNNTAVENITREYDGNYFKIINRTEWGAADSNGQLNRLKLPVGTVIIAHSDTHECIDFESCKFQMNILQLFYKQLRNFEDIGYNFLIGGDGAVYEGIGWDYIGYHTKGHNDYSIGIGFIGNYQNKIPTENQLSAATLLMNYGLQNNYLSQNYVIKGQRDFLPIVSPGNNIYNHMQKWDHYQKD